MPEEQSASIQEIAASAKSLAEMAQKLQNLVAFADNQNVTTLEQPRSNG